VIAPDLALLASSPLGLLRTSGLSAHGPRSEISEEARRGGGQEPGRIGANTPVSVRVTDVHFAVVRSYLRAAGCRHGLILNFAGLRVEARRVIASEPLDVIAPDLA